MAKEFVIIGGQKLEMETRKCAGGCGMCFRVTVGSKQILARNDCESICPSLVPSYKENMKKILIEKKKERILLASHRAKVEKRYNECVAKYKAMVAEGKHSSRGLQIVKDALLVCYVNSDSKERKRLLKGFSISSFAVAIGLEARIFRDWVKAYHLIYLPLGNKYKRGSFKGAVRSIRKIKPDMTISDIEKIFIEQSRKIAKQKPKVEAHTIESGETE